MEHSLIYRRSPVLGGWWHSQPLPVAPSPACRTPASLHPHLPQLKSWNAKLPSFLAVAVGHLGKLGTLTVMSQGQFYVRATVWNLGDEKTILGVWDWYGSSFPSFHTRWHLLTGPFAMPRYRGKSSRNTMTGLSYLLKAGPTQTSSAMKWILLIRMKVKEVTSPDIWPMWEVHPLLMKRNQCTLWQVRPGRWTVDLLEFKMHNLKITIYIQMHIFPLSYKS